MGSTQRKMFLICTEHPVAYDRKQYATYMIYTAYIREPSFLLDQLIWLDPWQAREIISAVKTVVTWRRCWPDRHIGSHQWELIYPRKMDSHYGMGEHTPYSMFDQGAHTNFERVDTICS